MFSGVSIFWAWGRSVESERIKTEVMQALEKYGEMDLGTLKDFQSLKQVGEGINQIMNRLLDDRPGMAYEVWKERGAEIQKRLADRADSLASVLRSEIKGQGPLDRLKAGEAVQNLLLAAQSRRSADYVIQNLEKIPERIWVEEDRIPGQPFKSPVNDYWAISPRDKINEEVHLGEPIYNNIWQTYFSKMLEISRTSGNIGGMRSLLSWLEKFRDSKLDADGKPKMFTVQYFDTTSGVRDFSATFYFKMLPDAEREELDRIIEQIKSELKTAEVRSKEREAANPCKKMGSVPNMEEWREELRCTDEAF